MLHSFFNALFIGNASDLLMPNLIVLRASLYGFQITFTYLPILSPMFQNVSNSIPGHMLFQDLQILNE